MSMSLNRTGSWALAMLLALTLTSTASAQQMIGDLQLFRPFEADCYDDCEPNQGFFLTWDLLVWNVSSPEEVEIGLSGASRRQFVLFEGNDDVDASGGGFETVENGLDTGGYEDRFYRGQRVEFGYMEDDAGWIVSAFDLQGHTQEVVGSDANVIFDDPQGRIVGFVDISDEIGGDPDGFADDLNNNFVHGQDGLDSDGDGAPDTPFPTDFGDLVPLPIRFDHLHAKLIVDPWSVEAMRVWRTDKTQFGGWFEVGVGLRYLNFGEEYSVFGEGGGFDDSYWSTESDNAILGPQFGVRWFNKCCRWTHSVELKFAPAVNFQSVRFHSVLGNNLVSGTPNFPFDFGPQGYNDSTHEVEFSPVVELRLQTSFQLTRAISVRAGYSAIYTDGIARASSMVNYSLDQFGILQEENTQDVTMHGFTIGIEVNR